MNTRTLKKKCGPVEIRAVTHSSVTREIKSRKNTLLLVNDGM